MFSWKPVIFETILLKTNYIQNKANNAKVIL